MLVSRATLARRRQSSERAGDTEGLETFRPSRPSTGNAPSFSHETRLGSKHGRVVAFVSHAETSSGRRGWLPHRSSVSCFRENAPMWRPLGAPGELRADRHEPSDPSIEQRSQRTLGESGQFSHGSQRSRRDLALERRRDHFLDAAQPMECQTRLASSGPKLSARSASKRAASLVTAINAANSGWTGSPGAGRCRIPP